MKAYVQKNTGSMVGFLAVSFKFVFWQIQMQGHGMEKANQLVVDEKDKTSQHDQPNSATDTETSWGGSNDKDNQLMTTQKQVEEEFLDSYRAEFLRAARKDDQQRHSKMTSNHCFVLLRTFYWFSNRKKLYIKIKKVNKKFSNMSLNHGGPTRTF